jgi:hypothetical protein
VLEALPDDATGQKKAVFAWSRALIEFVAWKGEEEGASEIVCTEHVRRALEANVYIGVLGYRCL